MLLRVILMDNYNIWRTFQWKIMETMKAYRITCYDDDVFHLFITHYSAYTCKNAIKRRTTKKLHKCNHLISIVDL